MVINDFQSGLNPNVPYALYRSRKQVKYLRNLHNGQGFGLSWQTAFQTTDKSVVEDYCRDKSVEFEWKVDGGLRLKRRLVWTWIARRPFGAN